MSTTIPATTWAPQGTIGEYVLGSADDIVDSSGNDIVDSSGNLLTTTDSSFVQISATTWSQNDGS